MNSLCTLLFLLAPPGWTTGDADLDCMMYLQQLEAASREDRITTCCVNGYTERRNWPHRNRPEMSYVGLE